MLMEQFEESPGGRTWSILAAPVATSEGIRAILTLRDTTDLMDLQRTLNRERTMAALGGLVAGVAHEVRNPLFGISANLDALEATGARGAEFEAVIGRMRSEVDRLASLMQELLDYGKPLESALAPESLGPVIAEAADSCAALAARSRVKVTTAGLDGQPPVSMARKRMLQVFQNLLQNAIQHSPPGGQVSVTMSPATERRGLALVVTVSDSGPGFSPQDLHHVFEPFFSRRRGGTGLGLAIVQKIVEEHGGTIMARNRLEGGAAVTVRLPLAPSAISRPAQPAPAAS
jgi:signal transduction histidine kinase